MQYRLKSDHGKTLKVTESLHQWWSVTFKNSEGRDYNFRIPATFLEESGWEPVLEKEPMIEEELDDLAESMMPPYEQLLRRAAEEIRAMRAERQEATASFAALEARVKVMENWISDSIFKGSK